MRVPVPDGSMIDLVCVLKKKVTVDEVNKAFADAAAKPMKGILEYCTDPIVSVDIIGNPASSILDAKSTMVMGDNMIKVVSWYDNEWGYSSRVVDLMLFAHKLKDQKPVKASATK
jgi:glyceraldehyde 3-phosphate dehydrogenase